MKTKRFVEVLPEYGWGWFAGPGNRALAVPDPFLVEIQGVAGDQNALDDLSGVVAEPLTHQFVGFSVALGRRSTIGQETRYSVLLTSGSARERPLTPMDSMSVTGFAKLGLLTEAVYGRARAEKAPS